MQKGPGGIPAGYRASEDEAGLCGANAHQSRNHQLEIDAAEIRIRAERRLGELLVEQKATVGLNRGAAGIGTSAVPQENRTPTLADIGVDKKLSSHAQRYAQARKATPAISR